MPIKWKVPEARMILFWTMLVAAAGATQVTAPRDSYPHLSPDGTTLVFHSNRNGRQAIWVSSADGSSPRLLFDDPRKGLDPGTPVWSPNGQAIAFGMRPAGADDENESEIYTIARDGTRLRRLTETPGDDSHPHWSRSGRIYFNSARSTPDPGAPWGRQWIDIYSMAGDGSDVRRHTECRSVCTYPVPSPDERSVVHRRITETLGQNWDLSPASRNSEIFVTPLGGGEPVNVSNSPAFDGWPTWSPDGRWILFSSNRDRVAYTGQIFAVRPDGTETRKLTDGILSRTQPSFSPSADRIFVYESIEGEAFEIGHIASFAAELGD